MTLKETVYEINRDLVSASFCGGVRGCPAMYGFLNDDASEGNVETCMVNKRSENGESTIGACEECWNRPFKEGNS